MLVNKENLLESLKLCARIAQLRAPLPIFKNVGLHFLGDNLCIYASNLTSSIGCEFLLPFSVEEEIRISCDASLLLNVLSNIHRETVDISINKKNNRLSITCEDDAYTIPFLPEQLPNYDSYRELQTPGLVPIENFENFFTHVQKANNLIKNSHGGDGLDPVTSAIFLDYLTYSNWKIASTDKSTLYHVQAGQTDGALQANVHRQDIAILKTLASLARFAGVSILKDKTLFAFTTKTEISIKFFTQNLEVVRPDIQGVISTSLKNEQVCKIYVQNNILAEALGKVAPVAETIPSLDVKTIAMIVEGGKQLALVAHNSEIGAWARTDVFAGVEKKDETLYTIGVNSRFLQKIARESFFTQDEEVWEIIFSEPSRPIVIQPDRSDPKLRGPIQAIYLIMPVMLMQETPRSIDELEKIAETFFA